MQNLYISRVSWYENEKTETIKNFILSVSDGINTFEKYPANLFDKIFDFPSGRKISKVEIFKFKDYDCVVQIIFYSREGILLKIGNDK